MTDTKLTTEERIEAMFQRTEEIHAHLVGTMDRRGLTRRVEDLERRARTSWIQERGTKALDALILGTVVAMVLIVLTNGVKSTLRDVVGAQAQPPCAISKREIVAQRGLQLQRRSVNSISEGE